MVDQDNKDTIMHFWGHDQTWEELVREHNGDEELLVEHFFDWLGDQG